jgi:adenine-specific DNA-methyltransferase
MEELVRQISDMKLRDEIAAEIRELKKRKRFGLVFEEHLPEMLRLPKAKIRLGNLVAHRDAPGCQVWRRRPPGRASSRTQHRNLKAPLR